MFSLQHAPVQMEHHYPPDMGYPPHDEHPWMDHHSCPPSAHHTPMQEYAGFSFSPVNGQREPPYGVDMPYPRTSHQPLHQPVVPTWPSMLTSQSMYMQPMLPTAPRLPLPSASAPPLPLALPPPTSLPPAPRRTLTDADRRRMCQYHEDNPTKKQNEIGEIFGVERSTVSKVLRQKEKYLTVDESRSPIKRSKGKFPDIERALTNWARNYQRQGKGLTDELIKEKLQFFATTVGGSEGLRINNDAWLERFKQKNQLMGQKPRKSSLPLDTKVPYAALDPSPPMSDKSSPLAAAMSATRSQDGAKLEAFESPGLHRPFHSQSNASLSSVFSEGAVSSYSGGATGQSSPLFTPDSASLAQSPFVPPSRPIPPTVAMSNHSFRPRSMTMPQLGPETYLSPPPSSDAMTPKLAPTTILDLPVSNVPRQLSMHGGRRQSLVKTVRGSASPSMPPPPLSRSIQSSPTNSSTHQFSPSSATNPSQDEAREALKIVMNFLTNQPNPVAEPQELFTMHKLMDKLQLQGSAEMPGGFQRVVEQQHHEFPVRRRGSNFGIGASGY